MKSGDTTALVRAGDPALQEEVVGHGFIQPGKGLAGKGTRKKYGPFTAVLRYLASQVFKT